MRTNIASLVKATHTRKFSLSALTPIIDAFARTFRFFNVLPAPTIIVTFTPFSKIEKFHWDGLCKTGKTHKPRF